MDLDAQKKPQFEAFLLSVKREFFLKQEEHLPAFCLFGDEMKLRHQ